VRDKPMFTRGAIRVFDDGLYWEWAGRRRRPEDADAEAHVEDLAAVPAKDLQAALRRFYGLVGEVDVRVFTDGTPDDDLEFIPVSPVSFTLVDDKLVMILDVYGDRIPDDQEPTGEAAQRVEPLVSRKRMWLVSVTEELDDAGRWWHAKLTIGFHLRGRSCADVVADGLEMVELLDASIGGLTRTTCADLIRAGHVHALLGQPEGTWLEVKRQHYPLRELSGKLRIAQTVAQFANADTGGLIVVGLATKKVESIDTIHAVTAQPRDANIRRRYVQALQEHLYPQPDDLTIEVIAAVGLHGEGDLIVIDIPPQPEEHKPFLVHGAIADGNVYGSYISLVRRRGDEGVSTTAAAIHSTLAAGRALLRRGQLPETPRDKPDTGNL
jgi:hypothetical protein